jgi:hypothetical protein
VFVLDFDAVWTKVRNNAVAENNIFSIELSQDTEIQFILLDTFVACVLPWEPKMTLLVAGECFKSLRAVLRVL